MKTILITSALLKRHKNHTGKPLACYRCSREIHVNEKAARSTKRYFCEKCSDGMEN